MLYEMGYNKRIRILQYFGGYIGKSITNKITDKFTNKKILK